MRDVIDFVLVQADALDEINLDLVARGDATQQFGTGPALLLRDS